MKVAKAASNTRHTILGAELGNPGLWGRRSRFPSEYLPAPVPLTVLQ